MIKEKNKFFIAVKYKLIKGTKIFVNLDTRTINQS